MRRNHRTEPRPQRARRSQKLFPPFFPSGENINYEKQLLCFLEQSLAIRRNEIDIYIYVYIYMCMYIYNIMYVYIYITLYICMYGIDKILERFAGRSGVRISGRGECSLSSTPRRFSYYLLITLRLYLINFIFYLP